MPIYWPWFENVTFGEIFPIAGEDDIEFVAIGATVPLTKEDEEHVTPNMSQSQLNQNQW